MGTVGGPSLMAMLLLLAGCDSTGRDLDVPDVLQQYLAADSCADRLPLIADLSENRQTIEANYASAPKGDCDWIDRGLIRKTRTMKNCDGLIRSGKTCVVDVWTEGSNHPSAYCLVGSDKGPRVDWACSTGHNDPSLRKFKLLASEGATAEFRLWAQLSDYYSSGFSGSRAVFLSLKMANDDLTEHVRGYLAKQHGDAEAIVDLLADGKPKRVTVQLRVNDPKETSVMLVMSARRGWWRDRK